MSTGYTYNVKDGISFEQFAMQCARAFGALVSMRDEPNGAKIPDSFEPDTYHPDQIAQDEAKLDKLSKMTEGKMTEGEIKEIIHDEYVSSKKQYEDEIVKCNDLKNKYGAMLEKARNWKAPSKDHEGLKNFMIEQLEKSMEADCDTSFYERGISDLKETSIEDYLRLEYTSIHENIKYHKDAYEKECKNVEGRNVWIKQLRDSLK